MVQGGDPTGTGKGGESIWKKKFRDEFSPSLTVNYFLKDFIIAARPKGNCINGK